MTDSNWTLRFPRTTRCDGHAIYYYRTPLTKRLFYACIRHGWISVLAALAVLVLSGCAGDIDDKRADDASLRDALQQAQHEAKEQQWAISQK